MSNGAIAGAGGGGGGGNNAATGAISPSITVAGGVGGLGATVSDGVVTLPDGRREDFGGKGKVGGRGWVKLYLKMQGSTGAGEFCLYPPPGP